MTDITTKTTIVGPFKLDSTGFKSIGKSFLITLGGAAIGFVGNLTGIVDFGNYTTLAATLLPFVANVLYKFLGSYESSTPTVTPQ